jgi:hypothetical protein
VLLPVAAIGLIALLLDAYPSWGADLGGAVGIGAGFAVMGLVAAELRTKPRWLVVALVAGGLAAAAMAWLDWRRGPERWTHLGGFVETVINGGLWEVLARKGAMWLRLSIGPAVGLIVIGLICLYLARRGAFAGLRTKAWQRAPMRRPVLAGLVALWVVGSAVNDSGLVIVIAGLLVAGPALVAGLVQVSSPASAASAGRTSP